MGLTQLYARTALDYAWAASWIASKLAAGHRVASLVDWPDNEQAPEWGMAYHRPRPTMYPVQLPPPTPLGPWYAEQVTTLNSFLADTHQRMFDVLVRVLKVHPGDLRDNRLPQPRLLPKTARRTTRAAPGYTPPRQPYIPTPPDAPAR